MEILCYFTILSSKTRQILAGISGFVSESKKIHSAVYLNYVISKKMCTLTSWLRHCVQALLILTIIYNSKVKAYEYFALHILFKFYG